MSRGVVHLPAPGVHIAGIQPREVPCTVSLGPTSHIPGTSRLAAWISHFAVFSLPTCLLLTSFGFPPSLDGSLNVEAQTSRGELRRCVASSTRSELDGLVRSLLFLFFACRISLLGPGPLAA